MPDETTPPMPRGRRAVSKGWVPAEITRLDALRQHEVQSIGAALSRRNWQATEMAYNQLRDKIDRTLLDLRRANPPLSEYETWQLMERGP